MARNGVVVVFAGLVVLGCGVAPKVDPCKDIVCGEGRCAVVDETPACLCNPGFVAAGLSCSAVPPADLCASNPCANLTNSLCQVNAGRVACVCPASRVEVSGSCVVRTACIPNPCQNPRRTTCEIVGGAASCRCEAGYAPEGDGCSPNPVWTCAAQHNDGDSAEPDECPTRARPLIIDVEEQRSLAPAGDHDWYEVGVTPGRLFTFTAASASSTALLIEVFDVTGVTLLASDNRGGALAEVTFVAPAQTVMVRVRGVRASDTGAYAVVYRELGVDDYVNTSADAITLLPGPNPFSGNVQYAGDVDVVWLELPALSAVRLSLADAGTRDLVVEIARPDGGARVLNPGEVTTITTPVGESLLLTARGRSSRTQGAYSLSFDELGPDDHSDEAAFGTPLASDNVPVQGRFERSQDLDSFSVAQLADRLYRARWQGTNVNPQVTVLLPSGQLLSANSYGASGLVWKADQSRPAAVRLQGSTSSSMPSYTLAVEDLGFDDHSDALTNATPATQGVPIGGRLELPADIDTFSYTAVAGRIVQVTATVTSTGTTATLLVRVSDSSGATVAESNGSVGVLIGATGLYKAQVLRTGYSSTNDLISYSLTVTDQGTDDHPGTSAGATPLVVGTTASGAVQFGADIDAFAFTALAGHLYQASCTRSGTASCSFQVKDPAGQLMGSNSNSTFLVAVGGRWVVEVNSGSTYSPSLGAYSLMVADLGLEDHGATIATATPITLDTPVAGSIGYAQDVDVFSFSGVTGRIYGVAVSPGNVRIEVRNASNNVLGSSYNGAVSFLAPNAGPFFVFLTNYSVGAYALTVSDRGVDDHGNSASAATSLVLGTTQQGDLQYTNDLDFFSVPVLAGHHHQVTCTVSNGSCSLVVLNPGGGVIVNGYSTAGVSFKPPSGVTNVFIQVSSSSESMRYGLLVSDLGVDDHGDARPDATALVVDAPAIAGVMETSSDVDAFTVTVALGEVVRVNCTVTSGTACAMTLTSPSGSVISQSSSAVTSASAFLANQAGSYLVQVRGNGYTSGGGAYTLRTTRGGDDFTATTAIALGTPRPGAIDYVGDTDVFSLTLTQGVAVQMTLTSGARATVSGPTGSYVRTVYGGSPSSMVPSTSGTYLFTVATDSYYGALVSYTLTVQ